MTLLDKVGKLAMDAVDTATRVARKVEERVDPLIARSEVATKLRDRLRGDRDEDVEIPEPEANDSPFARPEDDKQDKPLAKPELPAQVFGRGTDPWTGRALQLLSDRDIVHEFVDLEAEGGMGIETQLVRETKQHDAPYVFLRGEFLGGFNALSELDRLGQLEERVKSPEEREAQPGRVRIVVPTRGAEARPVGEIGNPDDRK
jgi:glutaredoxin